MFYNETPTASGSILTFDVNPQPGDVIQFISPVTNTSTQSYTAVFSTGASFPLQYGGEEIVQAYLLYVGQTYLAVFTGNSLEITAQQAANAQGNTVNTEPYVVNTFLDPAYSGLLADQMNSLSNVASGFHQFYNFELPVTMTFGLSVTGGLNIEGDLTSTGVVSTSPAVSGNQAVNYEQLTDGSFSPVLGVTAVATAVSSGDATNLGQVQGLLGDYVSTTEITNGSLTPTFGVTTVSTAVSSGDATNLGQVQGLLGDYVSTTEITNGSLTPTFGVTTVATASSSGEATNLGQVQELINSYSPVVTGYVPTTGTTSPLPVGAGVSGSDAINYTQITDGSLAPTFGVTIVASASTSGEAVNLGQLENGSLNVSFDNVSSEGTTSLTNYQELKTSTSTSSTSGWTETLNLAAGTVQVVVLNSTGTLAFTGAAPNGYACSVLLYLEQGASGNATVTWPSGTMWPDGKPPTLSTAAGAIDIIVLTTFNAGSTWFGLPSGIGMAS